MDIATVVGMIFGILLIIGSIFIGGSGLGPFIDIPSIMIVFGGSVAAILINFPLSKVLGVIGIVKKCFVSSLPTPQEVILKFKEFAALARRDGLLAMESQLDGIQDAFLRRGLELVIAGSARDELVNVLETEVSCIEQRHTTGKKIMDGMASAAPAFGMIGTLIGLVQMLRTLDDPSKIGGGMAVALITTFYGALLSNLFFIPMAGKLESRSQEEVMIRELMIAGLLSLVEGHTPRVLEDRLQAFLAPAHRFKNEESQGK
jgi:chemotaxis protein MotA